MTNRLQNKIKLPKKTLSELLNDKSVLTGRAVVHRIKDKTPAIADEGLHDTEIQSDLSSFCIKIVLITSQ